MIRCYQCKHYNETSKRKHSGWCTDTRDGRKKVRVDAVDYCDTAEPLKKDGE